VGAFDGGTPGTFGLFFEQKRLKRGVRRRHPYLALILISVALEIVFPVREFDRRTLGGC
jgi:hypothetical protein